MGGKECGREGGVSREMEENWDIYWQQGYIRVKHIHQH